MCSECGYSGAERDFTGVSEMGPLVKGSYDGVVVEERAVLTYLVGEL